MEFNYIYYYYKYIIYIVSSGMRKRKVFRETVITVIVIAFEEKTMVCELGKLWFVIYQAMFSLFQNYELGLLTGFVFWGC